MPKYTVLYTIRHDEGTYEEGDLVEFSKKEAAPLLEVGAIEPYKEPEVPWPMTAEELITHIVASEDADEVDKILEWEGAGKARKTVLEAAAARLNYLSSPPELEAETEEEPQHEPPAPPEPPDLVT